MSKQGAAESPGAATLARGLQLLQCFLPGQAPLGNGELSARTGLDRVTIARLTHTLVQLGYLRRDHALRKYRLGPATLALAYPLLASMRIRQVAKSAMKALATQVGGVVGLGIRDRADMLYIEAAYPSSMPPPFIDRGMTVPVVASAVGLAWLAKGPVDDRQQALNQAGLKYPSLCKANLPRLLKTVMDLERKGYCVSRGYLSPDRWAVAVPLRTTIQGELYVFNCAAGAAGTTPERVQAAMGPLLVEMVKRVEAQMGME